MPNDFAVHATPSLIPAPAIPAASDLTGSDRGSPAAPTRAAEPPAEPSRPNPSLRLDGELGMVVMEFHSASGAVTASIPTERQLESYRIWERTGTGTAPVHGRSSDPA